MYMLPFGSRFTDAPDVGGALTQWHVHEDLCLTNDPTQKTLAGFVAINGKCQPGTAKAGAMPMLHVWVAAERLRPVRGARGRRRRSGAGRPDPAVRHAARLGRLGPRSASGGGRVSCRLGSSTRGRRPIVASIARSDAWSAQGVVSVSIMLRSLVKIEFAPARKHSA